MPPTIVPDRSTLGRVRTVHVQTDVSELKPVVQLIAELESIKDQMASVREELQATKGTMQAAMEAKLRDAMTSLYQRTTTKLEFLQDQVQRKMGHMRGAHQHEIQQALSEQAIKLSEHKSAHEKHARDAANLEATTLNKQMADAQERARQLTADLNTLRDEYDMRRFEIASLQTQLATANTKLTEQTTALAAGAERERLLKIRHTRLEEQLAHAVRMMLKPDADAPQPDQARELAGLKDMIHELQLHADKRLEAQKQKYLKREVTLVSRHQSALKHLEEKFTAREAAMKKYLTQKAESQLNSGRGGGGGGGEQQLGSVNSIAIAFPSQSQLKADSVTSPALSPRMSLAVPGQLPNVRVPMKQFTL
eukprot:TRINITY_DN13941_c0_g1_i1.p2 TRINITY_DN13941_c0_g1~~TRINITY_DN13941_c0_g1_i1.p2  ORF type:complete len:365 (+),score=106.96 TRINITY_DN13941_c0_g1_i1:70-1164(+)